MNIEIYVGDSFFIHNMDEHRYIRALSQYSMKDWMP